MSIIQTILGVLNKPKNVKEYGHIYSLGHNCETAFRLCKVNGFLESNLFAWGGAIPRTRMVQVLRDIDSVGAEGFTEPTEEIPLHCCKKTGSYFHGRAPMFSFRTMTPQEKKAEYDELVSRVNYLKEKFKKNSADGEKNLYVYKHLHLCPESLQQMQEMYTTLEQVVKNEFDFLIVLPRGVLPEAEAYFAPMPHVYVRRVKCFSPEAEATSDKKGDQRGWNRIFREFVPKYKITKTQKFKFRALV